MNIERLDLPNGQWADRHKRPTHGQMKQIERMTRQAIESDDYLSAQDAMILTLVSEWRVLHEDGTPLALSRDSIDNAPQDIIGLIYEDLTKVVEQTSPNPQGTAKSRPRNG